MRLPKMTDQTKIIVCTAVALVGVDLAVRAMMTPKAVFVNTTGDVVTAREFRMVDERGNLRLHMYTDQNSEPGIVLYDREGRKRAQLDSFETIPSLILYNPNGERSTYYGMDYQGRSILHMYGDSGDGGAPLATMSVSESQGVPGFTFQGRGQTVNFQNGILVQSDN
jgi:hypothetical protein